MTPVIFWVVCYPIRRGHYPYYPSLATTKRHAISKFEEDYKKTWKEAKKSGYIVKKMLLSEFEDD
jgi:hypothetical protein